MPAHNEEATLEDIVALVLAEPHEKELIIVDDGSTDGTRALLEEIAARHPDCVRVILQEKNQGKGAAVRTGIAAATAEVIIIQDADLEYDPQEYGKLLEPLEAGAADVVYGSRFLGRPRSLSRLHYWGNRFLTVVTNLLFGAALTDMETCYKALPRELIQSIPLRSNTFDIEPEITAKVLKRGARLVEVPISYQGRSFAEGKKIHWHDGFRALRALIKYRFVD
jgi:glycosyltransferase involved in cell wall biosynthesis